jgi:hypothetical protein
MISDRTFSVADKCIKPVDALVKFVIVITLVWLCCGSTQFAGFVLQLGNLYHA